MFRLHPSHLAVAIEGGKSPYLPFARGISGRNVQAKDFAQRIESGKTRHRDVEQHDVIVSVSQDVESLLPVSPAIRLVKGAYNEPAELAFPRKGDVDDAYRQLAEQLLGEAARQRAKPVFGTHDMALVEQIRKTAVAKKVDQSSYEFHMLYGIRAEEQRQLAGMGVEVRVLISYGSAWFAWYMRRLAERPANMWFVLKNVV